MHIAAKQRPREIEGGKPTCQRVVTAILDGDAPDVEQSILRGLVERLQDP